MVTKRRWGLFLIMVFLSFGLVFSVANSEVRIEKYTNKADFLQRLGGGQTVNVVNFDDIDTSGSDPVAFPADQYLNSHGIIITGEDGQYVSRNFGLPFDFVSASSPNMYAPGAIDWSTSGWAGGNYTDVTFSKDTFGGSTAGFGLHFIDADWPADGPSSFAVYDNEGNELGTSGTVKTLDAKKRFVGLVAVDKATNRPIAAIARAYIVNGSGWPGNDLNEGVGLDNFVFRKPVVTPVPSTVNPSQGTVGTEITITGSNFGIAIGRVLVGGFRAEVLDWQPDSIVGRLNKTPRLSDFYAIEIQTGERAYASWSSAFNVEAPQNLLLVPDHGVPKDQVTATGSFFGTTPKKVLMGTTECTIVSWDMDPATGASQIVFKVPRGVKPGPHTVKVVNRVGVVTATFTID